MQKRRDILHSAKTLIDSYFHKWPYSHFICRRFTSHLKYRIYHEAILYLTILCFEMLKALLKPRSI